jgi:hypothetical protein
VGTIKNCDEHAGPLKCETILLEHSSFRDGNRYTSGHHLDEQRTITLGQIHLAEWCERFSKKFIKLAFSLIK